MKAVIKSIIAKTPYRVMRRGKVNRFSAIEDALISLKKRGFAPRDVIDAGAHVGVFSGFTLALFPNAKVQAIEPQPGCQEALRNLRDQAEGRLVVHQVAIGSPDEDDKYLNLEGDTTSTSTGAHITFEDVGAPVIKVKCIALDRLFQDRNELCEGALLKLDLQGYELQALRGGLATLAMCDVVLTEISFYAQAYEPTISELVTFLSSNGFELYDIASLYARPRDDRPRQGDFIFVRVGSHLMTDRSWS